MVDQVLHLVVPGLLGPMPRLDAAAAGQRFPVIERWLARAERFGVAADSERLLFDLFGVSVAEDADLPTAPLCYLADTGQPPHGVVYLATPVHLRPDQDRLLLFDRPATDLSAGEAADFVAVFNEHFREQGWRLSAPTPGRWYLHLATRPDLLTHPLGEVVGRNVDLFLPQGGDAPAWRQRLNEVQMLFHGVPANAQREASGRLAVNGLWLHGGGTLPAADGRRLQLKGEPRCLLQGLAKLGGAAGTAGIHWVGGAQRAVWDVDARAWLAAVGQVESLLSSLSGTVCLYPGDGHGYRYTGARRWLVWRRPKPLCESLLSETID